MNLNWNKEIFKPKTALIEVKSKNIHLYHGQKYDPTKFKLEKYGWTHEHCDNCFIRIEENDIMYVKEGEIKCDECYLKTKSST